MRRTPPDHVPRPFLSSPAPACYAQSGFTLIELMIAVAIIGILAAIGVVSYQTQVRQTHLTALYQEINHFRLPYQILMNEGAGVTDFSPSGLNMPEQTQYCQFNVTAPNANAATPNAIVCQIRNLNFIASQNLSLDYNADGSWQCRASSGIPNKYLPVECR